VDHQGLIPGLKLHCQRPETVQKILQRLTLPLLHAKKIEEDQWSGLINNELFSEQHKKLIEGGDVAVKKAIKALQSCACERTHEHLPMYGVYSSRNDHLGIECHKMALGVFYSREKQSWALCS